MEKEALKAKTYVGSCCGNSFIVVDCRTVDLTKQEKAMFASTYIPRYAVDSALFIGNIEGFDAFVEIFEQDGSESDSCGNGILLIAYFLGLQNGVVWMKGGPAVVMGDFERQAILLETGRTDVKKLSDEKICFLVTVGEPHMVHLVDDVGTFDLLACGKKLQKSYSGGINIDAVQRIDESHYLIRTYERGVLAETRACGTGSLSSYLVVSHLYKMPDEVAVEFKSAGGSHWVSRRGTMLKLETLKDFCTIRAVE